MKRFFKYGAVAAVTFLFLLGTTVIVLPVVINEPVDLRPFRPISALCEKNNPRNINYMSPVIFSTCLDIERKFS
ncbi:MAG: hypothetical protein GQ542_13380 [Desulforhopalus sp.]|nr:hypothetical protein [Desulforhopalus sp.]